jgi:hypothetical protein
MSDELTIRYVPLSTVALWERNPKRHSIGDLAASIERYGFKEIPKYEPRLNNGQGGIVAGNGRIETLAALHQQGKPAPRGIIEQDGEWLVPVTFGVDAASQEEAEAYGIDSNNLSLSGGDFTAWDMSRLWGEGYTDILAGLATADALPITVDGDALDGLLNREANGILDAADLWKGMPEFEQQDQLGWKTIRVHFENEEDYHAFARLVNQTLTLHTKYIWYPYQAPLDAQSHRVADES